jgi:uncharacterized RDD family membrane protein YckC
MEETNYPPLLARIKAVFTDVFIILLMLMLCAYLFSAIGNVSANIKKFAFVFIFILYDPLTTSLLGGTLGHLINGLRVRKESDLSKKVPLHLAFVRFFVNSLLGWISLLTVTGNEKRRAIHDMAVDSVVVYRTAH